MRLAFPFIYALSLLARHVQGACDPDAFQACTTNMADFWFWDIIPYAMWTDFYILYNFLVTYFSMNVGDIDNLLRICNGFEQFYGCMSGNEECYTVPYFVNNANLSVEQAFAYAGLLQQYKFECGAGLFTVAHDNLPCVQRVTYNFNSTLTGCIGTFQTNVYHDALHACTYYSDLLNCYSAPFDRAQCGYAGSTDKWWACEAIRQFARPQLPNCVLSCDLFNGASGSDEWLQEHYKVVGGQQWFKLPDKVVKVNGKLERIEGAWMNN